jgi:membrane fusion protein (multidrug efflux system)
LPLFAARPPCFCNLNPGPAAISGSATVIGPAIASIDVHASEFRFSLGANDPMSIPRIPVLLTPLMLLVLPACHHEEEKAEEEHHKIIATTPEVMDVTVTRQYVCQIRSQNHINVRALQDGYLEAIPIKEGQSVKKGDVLFQILPTLYRTRYETELAEAAIARLELSFTQKLFDDKVRVVSESEVALFKARLAKAEAKARQAQAELNFATITAPFDGIVDRLREQQGSLIKEKDILTTLSDNSTMWVYFNVPEARYLEYMGGGSKRINSSKFELLDSTIELVLANGHKFNHPAGNTVTVEGQFNNETGNIAFRADLPNPEGLLRHGQTGTVLVNQTLHKALVIPQRATYEFLDKRYVYVVGDDHVVHQRQITVLHEKDDIFIIGSGLEPKDKIILDGIRQVRDGEKAEYETIPVEKALANSKHHAE